MHGLSKAGAEIAIAGDRRLSRMQKERGLSALTSVLLLLGSACAGRPAPFYSMEGNFSIAFLLPPSRAKVPIVSPVGPVEITIYAVDLGPRAFFATYYDLPDSRRPSDAELLSRERDRGLANTGCTLIREAQVTFQGHPALDVVADQASGTHRLRARIFIIGRRLYSLIAIGPEDRDMDAASVQFFDSFSSP
jgi:hypothetical protein